ncbi:MAG: hypothetical protein R6X32_20510 [Chloroflexota bacterium]|jgi:hypothetical protein
MATPLLVESASILCTHGATVSAQASNKGVTINGQAVVVLSDVFTVSGCPFQIPIGTGTKPQPCVKVQWVVPAKRVRVNGQPVLLQDSTGICQSAEQIPQGSPNVVMTQFRVKGT